MNDEHVSLNQVARLFEERGFPFEHTEPEAAIQSSFVTQMEDGRYLRCPLVVLPFQDPFGNTYYRFTINPFIPQPDEGHPLTLYQLVGRINHRIPQLKFTFDSDNDLELVYDYAANGLGRSEFDRIIQQITDYTVLCYRQLETMDLGDDSEEREGRE